MTRAPGSLAGMGSQPLVVCIGFGMVAGLGDSGLILWRHLTGHHQMIGLASAWMAPLGTAALMGIPGLALTALAARSPTPRTWRWTLGVALSLSTWALAGLIPGLRPVAAVLLALGVGVRGSAVLSGAKLRIVRLSLRAAAGIGLSCLLAGGAQRAFTRWTERRAINRLGGTGAGHPNLLLIILDTVRDKSIHLLSRARPPTPELAGWAVSGVRFTGAISPSSWTVPAHASFLTGRWGHDVYLGWEIPLPDSVPTLAEVLQRRGYATAAFVGNFRQITTTTGLDRGFLRFEGHPVSWGELLMSGSLGRGFFASPVGLALFGYSWETRKRAADVNQSFLQWLDQEAPRPFFAFLNYFDAHGPYLPPPPFDTLLGPTGGRRLDFPGSEAHLAPRRDGTRAQCV